MNSIVEATLENLIEAILGQSATLREKHLLRQSLRGLVRLAKAEQMLEIKTSVKKLTGIKTANRNRLALNLAAKDRAAFCRLQQKLEFDRDSSDATKSDL